MSMDALYILVIIAFFVIVGVGVHVVSRLLDPGREWPEEPAASARTATPGTKAVQRIRPASPVEKRKPTPGSVST
jgi:hypothetical protein